MKKALLFVFVYFLFVSSDAYAYLDPGTGSIIIQAILGAVAAFFTSIAIYWEKVKNFFKKISKKNKDNKNL
tara:strand:- start:3382 stop:3594 length:213 start_codon:yes stop_codon:yes gene_type:complete